MLYINSFTKKLLPSLRVGYLVASDDLMPSLLAAKRLGTLGGGPTHWLELPMKVSLDRLRERLRARGVNIESASGAFDGPPHLHGFRVSYAFLAPETLDRALELVADAISKELS
jgi:DNA-binding transcriptional MocR family regulator